VRLGFTLAHRSVDAIASAAESADQYYGVAGAAPVSAGFRAVGSGVYAAECVVAGSMAVGGLSAQAALGATETACGWAAASAPGAALASAALGGAAGNALVDFARVARAFAAQLPPGLTISSAASAATTLATLQAAEDHNKTLRQAVFGG
jgi:hypothetical protein